MKLCHEKKKIFNEITQNRKKTKVLCSLGPSSDSVEVVLDLIKNGMNVAVIDLSIHSKKESKDLIKIYKDSLKKIPGSHCALMVNLKGNCCCVGDIEEREMHVKQLSELTLQRDKSKSDGKTNIYLNCSIFDDIKVGEMLIFVDSTAKAKVISVMEGSLTISFTSEGVVTAYRQVTIQNKQIPFLSPFDEEILESFVLKEKVDIINVPNVETSDEIEEVRNLMGPRGDKIKIIAMVTSKLGIENLDDILDAADGIAFSRADLHPEIKNEKVFILQKYIIDKVNLMGKPMIVKLQEMDSLRNSKTPNMSDSTDLANVVIDGADCVWLGNETAFGKWPVDNTSAISKIMSEAEQCINYEVAHDNIFKASKLLTTEEAICAACVKTASDIVVR